MQTPRLLAALACSAALFSPATAQGTKFAPPVMLKAGAEVCGKGRMYPSPVAYDLDRDGRFDIVVGDLRGHLTFALQREDGSFGPEQKLKDAAGKILDFGNW
ncbi:MAG: VCBS repeat-containing protein [Planctomycetes bacterium]|nr:VCBS repeat-containing protein [Planctomycetota bacterium]